MTAATLHNYIRTHRRNAGLSQRELGRLLGHECEGPVSRHELSKSLPPLLSALAYEVVFGIPAGEIFPGVKQAVATIVEERIRAFREELENSTVHGRRAIPIAQKLEWICERNLATDA